MDNKISDLCLELQPLAKQFILKANAAVAPSVCKITITWRSGSEQGAAYDKGSSKARAGQSPHNATMPDGTPASKAFDFDIIDEKGSYVTDGADPRYAIAGQIGKSLGLWWGGDWNMEQDGCNPDFDHLEMANWRTA